MATVSGTIRGITLLHGVINSLGDRKTFLLTADFTRYTASADSANLVSVDTAIQNAQQNGKTFTVRAATTAGAGRDITDDSAVYALALITNSSGTLALELGGTTTEADNNGSEGVAILVVGDES